MKINGVVLYEGPSMLDGAPIVVIATGLATSSANSKTGALIQTWILRQDVKPTEACRSGQDASICGACPHRGTTEDGKNVGRSCYVTVVQAPNNVWKTYKRGRYPAARSDDFAGRDVRLGSYGDPAAVPSRVWEAVAIEASNMVGYTHQWRDFPEMARWCMASVDTTDEQAEAKFLGFRTFRVTLEDPRMYRNSAEIVCPASAEMGHKTTCDKCKACGGLSAKAKADVVIQVHGTKGKVANAERRVAA